MSLERISGSDVCLLRCSRPALASAAEAFLRAISSSASAVSVFRAWLSSFMASEDKIPCTLALMADISASLVLNSPLGSVRSNIGGTNPSTRLVPPTAPENAARLTFLPCLSLHTSTPSIFPSLNPALTGPSAMASMCSMTARAALRTRGPGLYLNGSVKCLHM